MNGGHKLETQKPQVAVHSGSDNPSPTEAGHLWSHGFDPGDDDQTPLVLLNQTACMQPRTSVDSRNTKRSWDDIYDLEFPRYMKVLQLIDAQNNAFYKFT